MRIKTRGVRVSIEEGAEAREVGSKHLKKVMVSRFLTLTCASLFALPVWVAEGKPGQADGSESGTGSVRKRPAASGSEASEKTDRANRGRREKKEEPEEKDGSGVPRIHAASAIVVDASSGKVLRAWNADERRAVASTQKLMTALLVAESGGLERSVTIQKSDTWAEPSKLEIAPGEVYRKGDLLRILLVKSMNDVARALARDTAGSVEAFAARMNARAEELGMRDSRFVNPNGLPAVGQYSTARDMAKLAVAAYRVKAIRDAVRLKELRWESPKGEVTTFHNTNRVLSSLEYCNGMKTGYTVAAGFCLVSSAAQGGREVISVVLGDAKEFVWRDSHQLLVWGLGLGATAVSER